MRKALAALPGAADTTLRIAEMCNLKLDLSRQYLPQFHVEDGSPPEKELRRLATAGLAKRFPAGAAPENYRERLENELKVIEGKGYSSYFLIVNDFVQYARNNGIPASPRGSGDSNGWQMERQLGRTRNRRHFNFYGKFPGDLFQPAPGCVRGFGDKIKSAQAERIQCGIRALGSVAADHDDGNGISLDDLAKHIEAVHPRHFQIERDDVGAQLLYFFQSQKAIHRCSHHLDGPIALQ
jgi:hypothetical protein